MEGILDQPIDLARLPRHVGGSKAQRLSWLLANGYRTPPGVVVSKDVADLTTALQGWVVPEQLYVVRSSAGTEDGEAHSFAGQFESILDLRGVAEVAEAIAQVRRSGSSERVDAYQAESQGEVTCLVQPMIQSVAGGVVFTRNPVTGLDEVVVEAAAGRSSQVLAEGRDPLRWVHRWGEFVVEPAESPIAKNIIEAVVVEARDIAARFGSPLDLEWVWDGEELWWVQLRPIGGLDITVYSNRIASDVLPGAIKPLVWSVNVPLVNRAWIRLFDEATGPTGLEADDLAKSFGYHAYFNMTAIGNLFEHMGMPRDSLELLLGLPEGPDRPSMKPGMQTMALVPRLAVFALRRGRAQRAAERLLAEVDELLEPVVSLDLAAADDEKVWGSIRLLDDTVGRIAEANIVVPLLLNIWTAMLRRAIGHEALLSVDLDSGMEDELAEHDPQVWLDRISAHDSKRAVDSARSDFVSRFGHLSDSGNDFSVPTWAEQPALVDRLIDAAGDARQRPSMLGWDDFVRSLPLMSRARIAYLGKMARRYRLLREAIGSTYTRGYGLYRPAFLELGARLATKGVLAASDDVFYLTRLEVADPPEDSLELVHWRRAELEAALGLDLPETIYGDDFVPSPKRDTTAQVLLGTGASRGKYTGPVKVVRSVSQIDELQDGDVLVVPFSDVGWTPLFAKAGAVVAESGGLLSHSSIVAREYGIPCVVSVRGATNLQDGAIVAVNGHYGEVEVIHHA